MELDLKNFSSTLAVGVFVVGICFLGMHLFWRPWQNSLLNVISKWGTMGQALAGLFLVLIVFGCGIVGETISNRFVDADYGEWIHEVILPTEKEMRADTLFGEGEGKPKLAAELAATGRLSRFLKDERQKATAALVEEHLLAHPECSRDGIEKALSAVPGVTDSVRSLEQIASSLYYTAKNILTEHDNIAQELWTIQRRLDFCRSIATYSALFSFLGFVGLLVHFVQGRRHPGSRFAIPWAPKLLFAFGLLALFAITRYCYASEEREFDIRTFGYFSTLPEEALPTISTAALVTPGDFSGAARLANGQILFVHDAKPGSSTVRAGTVDLALGVIEKVEVEWPHGQPVASDLEAVCTVPGGPDVLMCESGYYRKDVTSPLNFGRVFRCEPTYAKGAQGKLLKLVVTDTWYWPKNDVSYTEDIEGLACVSRGGQLYVIAAQREGTLYCAPLTGGDHPKQLQFLNPAGQKVLDPQLRPSSAFLERFDRPISDLHLDDRGWLWATAADEPKADSDFGPFRSAIYTLGQVTNDAAALINFAANPKPVEVHGFKVEALTGAGANRFFIGTDDEEMGGVWRLVDSVP